MQAYWDKFISNIKTLLLDDDRRMKMQFMAVCILLGVVSAGMTVVNIFTQKHLLMIATLAFAVVCGVNALLSFTEKFYKFAVFMFKVEFSVLLSFFIVSGTPEGFSAIWAAMLPSCGLLLFRRRDGSILSFIMFVIIAFFFWTPLGQSFLQYNYTESFKLRFPILYIAFYLVSLFLESVRQLTYDRYRFLYTHDPLTGLLNRRGFAEYCKEQLAAHQNGRICFMIADIDFFKQVNDRYGHFVGDRVLECVAQKLQALAGENVCRWGGEEFSAILDGNMTEEKLKQICEDFSAAEIDVEGIKIPLCISIGAVDSSCTESTTVDKLCLVADDCLYRAKNGGRNHAVLALR